YEYAPDAINERTEETLREKHNEALKVMPVLFEKMDYQVILCDLPYADYVATSNMSIFDEYETMRTYNLEQTYAKNSQEKLLDSRQRGIAFWEYVFFKTSPYFIQPFIYQCINDRYDKGSLVYSDSFYSSYHVLENLCEMTKIDEGDTDYFMELDNNMTHEPCEFQVPEYTYPFVGEIDNSAYDFQTPRVTGGRTMRFDNRVQVNHYQTNVAALMMLGEWFTYLQEMGVYDNTRIVIAADHGFAMEQFDDLVIDEEMDAQAVNCLLMFKDFESKDWKVAEEFMTNADVPTLTLGGLVENAVNPFTGVTIDSTRKYESPIKITLSSNLRDGNVFDTSDAPWYSVHDDIFQRENWTKIKD
ncbi:MAG: hypothetical protein IJ833_04595, partial [Lachnospiraceae bacterium]|nr:hypothetical protein [Lachnospiraceae bacterium]